MRCCWISFSKKLLLDLMICGHTSLGSSMLSDMLYSDFATVLSNILTFYPGPCARESNMSVLNNINFVSSFWNGLKIHHLIKLFFAANIANTQQRKLCFSLQILVKLLVVKNRFLTNQKISLCYSMQYNMVSCLIVQQHLLWRSSVFYDISADASTQQSTH